MVPIRLLIESEPDRPHVARPGFATVRQGARNVSADGSVELQAGSARFVMARRPTDLRPLQDRIEYLGVQYDVVGVAPGPGLRRVTVHCNIATAARPVSDYRALLFPLDGAWVALGFPTGSGDLVGDLLFPVPD